MAKIWSLLSFSFFFDISFRLVRDANMIEIIIEINCGKNKNAKKV